MTKFNFLPLRNLRYFIKKLRLKIPKTQIDNLLNFSFSNFSYNKEKNEKYSRNCGLK